jgi:hypothetical protein
LELGKRFLVIHDYQWGGGGYFVYAPSLDVVTELLELPRQGYEVFENDVMSHPYVKYMQSAHGTILSRDADCWGVLYLEDLRTGKRERFQGKI